MLAIVHYSYTHYICSSEDFESRSYPAVSWACTQDTVAAEDSTLGEEMFFKLLG